MISLNASILIFFKVLYCLLIKSIAGDKENLPFIVELRILIVEKLKSACYPFNTVQ